jgi:hypothetical protein
LQTFPRMDSDFGERTFTVKIIDIKYTACCYVNKYTNNILTKKNFKFMLFQKYPITNNPSRIQRLQSKSFFRLWVHRCTAVVKFFWGGYSGLWENRRVLYFRVWLYFY